MARKYLIGLLTMVLLLTANNAAGQWSLGGGASSFHGLNLPVHRVGFNAFVEIPRSTTNTLMVRAAYLLPNYYDENRVESIPSNDDMFSANAMVNSKTTYFAVDGGTRFYFFNDYDIGTAMYAGGYIKGILSGYKPTYSFIDKTINPDDYQIGEKMLYSVFFSFGGTIGVKQQLPRGALTLDVGMELVNQIYREPSVFVPISPLSFSLNLAYRFDWY